MGCGGLSSADNDCPPHADAATDGGLDAGDRPDTPIPEGVGHRAIALPNTGLYGGVFLKVSDSPDHTCEASRTVWRCAHWSVVVEMAWDLVKTGTTPIHQAPAREKSISASSIVYGPPGAEGTCDGLQISGTRGELAIDAIDEHWIRGRLSELYHSGDPDLALPRETVTFDALRCAGEWRIDE